MFCLLLRSSFLQMFVFCFLFIIIAAGSYWLVLCRICFWFCFCFWQMTCLHIMVKLNKTNCKKTILWWTQQDKMQENYIMVNSTRQNARKLYYGELNKTKCKKTILWWTQQDKMQENYTMVNSTRQNARKLHYGELNKTKCKKTILWCSSTRQNARKLYYGELNKTKCKKTIL